MIDHFTIPINQVLGAPTKPSVPVAAAAMDRRAVTLEFVIPNLMHESQFPIGLKDFSGFPACYHSEQSAGLLEGQIRSEIAKQ